MKNYKHLFDFKNLSSSQFPIHYLYLDLYTLFAKVEKIDFKAVFKML